MPLYDFFCPTCQTTFEEISEPNTCPSCPACGAANTERKMSAPSPRLTNPFPYKIGPKHPLANRMAAGGTAGASCGSAGGCGGGGFS